MAAQPRGGERNKFDCQFIFREVKILRDKQLGNGAYGAVFRAQCDSLLCAAKCMHTVLFDDPDPEGRRYQRDLFYGECEIMAGMKHPNIVQYLGYYEDRGNNDQPCLLMELLDENLSAYLERHLEEGRHVPFHTSIDFAHDVSMALDYLHKNLRMHCDLTSNNILILAGTRAKVTDFGQSVLVLPEYDFRVKGIQCPGSMCYMPPEALKADPIYDSSLDTFSFGVVLIQVLCREFPAPSSSTKIIEGFGPGGSDAILPVKEKDRRSLHIALVNPNHPLLTIALCCIEDDSHLRPPFTILTDQLTALKAMPAYVESQNKKPSTSSFQLFNNGKNKFDCQFIFREVKIHRDKQLGCGAYGAVYRAQCDSLLCAAKCIHTILFDDPDPEGRRYQRDLFYRECEIMAGMKHPNIVQYLGYYEDRGNNDQPCLLMELLDETLTAYLERNLKEGRHVPFHMSIDFAHDVSMALDYLHKNLRIHCNVASNNILILAGTRAKVTDFGDSVLVLPEYDFRVKGIQCPGTMCYMAPEALKADPIYDSSLDTFSFGVVLIQMLCREFPAPSSSTMIMEGFGPGGSDAILPVKEKDRRSLHIALVNPNHPLLTIALHCIEDDSHLRPPFTILTDQLTALKAMPEYEESRKENPGTLRPQLHDNWSPVNESRINDLERKIDQLEKYNGLLQGQVAQMEFAMMLDRQRLEGGGTRSFGQETAPTSSLALERPFSNPSSLPATLQPLPVPELKVGNKTLRWYPCSRLPSGLYSGSALCIKDKVYVSGQELTAIFEYDPQKNVWLALPDSPTASFALVAIRGVLAIVGGYTTQAYSNAVYSLVTVGNENKWTSTYPPMQDPRINPGAVVTNEYLIVAGGEIQAPRNRFLSWNVEMLHIDSKVWQTVDKLPKPVKRISMAILEEHLYVVGGITRNNQPLKEMFHTSLADLVNSATSNFVRRAFRSGTCWGSIAVPQVYSTLAILSGQVVLIGGWDNQPSLSIHAMNVDPRTRQILSWSPVGNLPFARFNAMATVLPGNRLMVIGGCGNVPGEAGEQVLDASEIAIPVA